MQTLQVNQLHYSLALLHCTILQVSGPELVGSTTGESEGRVRDVFAAALAEAPSMLFLDSLDVVAAKREVQCIIPHI